MPDSISEPQRLFARYLDDVDSSANDISLQGLMPSDYPTGRVILAGDDAVQAAVVLLCMEALPSLAGAMLHGGGGTTYLRQLAVKSLASRLLRRDLPLDEAQLIKCLNSASASKGIAWELPWAGLLNQVERFVQRQGMSAALRDAVALARKAPGRFAEYAENKKLIRRIDQLTGAASAQVEPAMVLGEPWADLAMSHLAAMGNPELIAWRALISYCLAVQGSKPTKKWLKGAKELVAAIGKDAFVGRISTWLDLVGVPGPRTSEPIDPYDINPAELISDHNATLLKGLAWCCIEAHDDRVIALLGDAAERCYKKIPMHGPRNVKVGNACAVALSQIGGAGVAQLGRLKARAKHASVRGVLDRAVGRSAAQAGLTTDELEERTTPTLGLTDVGIYEAAVGDAKVRVGVAAKGSRVVWITPAGKEVKSAPAATKAAHAATIGQIKRLVKDVDQMYRVQRARLEQLCLHRRTWAAAEFFERYLHHRLVGTIARRLIWRYRTADRDADGIWRNGRIEDAEGRELDWIAPDTRVEVWHPLFRSAEQVTAWRRRLEADQGCQPFKQAHREIYVLTDAERQTESYSNRFAAHVLRQHQFAALCHQRGWRYTLQGNWDSHNVPYLELPRWNLRAEYWVEPPVDPGRDENIFALITTDQVRFCPLTGNDQFHLGEPMPLEQVPAIVFSEVMRDVDLFVGVASIGNDPNWRDGGTDHHAYWQEYAFGDLGATAKTRRAVLEKLIPRLKIAPRCTIDDKFLIVRGDLRTYKIHLGSANILMKPNDQYLCIVPARGAAAKGVTESVYLPFDGDERLSIILSKALMLADDVKIKDASIVSQIARK